MLSINKGGFRWGLTMTSLIKRFWADETAATAIEYGLIAAGIAVAVITVVKNVGTNLKTTFTSVGNAVR